MDALISYGSEVKALGNGRIGGYLVRFSEPGNEATPPDASMMRDYFTPETDFGEHKSTPIFYHHAMDSAIGDRVLGHGELKIDDVGVWVEAQLSLRDRWEKSIYEMVKAGKLSWSSGTSAHTVKRVPMPHYNAHHIKRWLLGHDATLTPTPASGALPTMVVPIKSLPEVSMSGVTVPEHQPIDELLAGFTKAMEEQSNAWTARMDTFQQENAALREEIKALVALGESQHQAGWSTAGSHDNSLEDEIKSMTMWLRDPVAWMKSDNAVKAVLQAGSDIGGGYTVQPQQLLMNLLKDMDRETEIRNRATVHQVDTPEGLGQLTLDADMDDPTWTAELDVGSESSSMKLGKRELRPHPLARYILVSKTLIRQSRINVVDIVMQRMRYRFRYTMEHNYLNGDGQGKPLGMMVASANGIPTSRDVTTAGSTIAFDDLKSTKYKVRPAHWRKSVWMGHPNVAEDLAKLKDGNGRYLWQDSVTEDEPPRLYGRPFLMNEFMPESPGAGEYALLFGDLSYYYILDALNFTLTVSTERFVLSNQNAYIGRYEGDGAPMLPEAFARLKLKP